MIAYASNTGSSRNLATLLRLKWRILLSPRNPSPPEGFRFAIDNGAWSCYLSKTPFPHAKFMELIEKHGGAADFVVIPDKVAQGKESLEFSLSYLPKLKGVPNKLLAVQDDMTVEDVAPIVQEHKLGIFLGGSTPWKLKTMHDWGVVAAALGCYYHVGRVNTKRRIKLCAFAGADSFDGTSATRWSKTVPFLDSARRQMHLAIQ